MKKVLCCFKGESSSQGAAQNDGDDVDPQRPFGDNEFLNNAWLNNIELPDDRLPRETPRVSPPRIPHFTLRWQEILDGTQNLDDANLLGEGNFGQVYRCNIPRLEKVGAAKIQKIENAEAKTEFEAEIKTLSRANHPNVISLLGKCVTSDHRVIVYQFMPRGSLDHLLYADTRPAPGLQQQGRAVLNWERRMNIALGVAEALVYLHEELRTVHRDLKVANVLVDENFVPRLTDFGLATRMVYDANGIEKQTVIDPIKGTLGCIAPETEGTGLVSSKSDVYSYGVFLLTLFTGRKAYDRARPVASRKIHGWLMSVWNREECLPMVLDISMGNTFSAEGLNRLFQAARMCMDPSVIGRPTMRFVETMVRQAAAYDVVTLPLVERRRDLV
ncbi:Serine-threonine/tyrosine-protein kinase [Hirschfeldia incana]|nr:Serine-threonine/tyrosine-protein kinase [Hirschfeldia incana]